MMTRLNNKSILIPVLVVGAFIVSYVLFKSGETGPLQGNSFTNRSYKKDDDFLDNLTKSLLDQQQVQIVKKISAAEIEGVGRPYVLFLHRPEVDQYISSEVLQGKHDHHVAKLLKRMKEPQAKGKLFVDVGCNIGILSIPVAVSGAQVVAFEASKFNYECIWNSRNANQLHNLKINHNAVTEKSGNKICMQHDSRVGTPNMGGFYAAEAKGACDDEVTSVALDTYFKDLTTPIYVLKIDVEGYEPKVIQGAKRILTDPKIRPMHIYMEFIPKYISAIGEDPEEFLKIFLRYGYQVYEEISNNRVTFENIKSHIAYVDFYMVHESHVA